MASLFLNRAKATRHISCAAALYSVGTILTAAHCLNTTGFVTMLHLALMRRTQTPPTTGSLRSFVLKYTRTTFRTQRHQATLLCSP